MDAAAELGRNPVSKHQIQPEYGEMSRLTWDGTAEPVSRDQILRHARGQGNIIFPCSADHEQDWQPYPVDPYSAICDDHTYIHTYIYDTKTRTLIQLIAQSRAVQCSAVQCSSVNRATPTTKKYASVSSLYTLSILFAAY